MRKLTCDFESCRVLRFLDEFIPLFKIVGTLRTRQSLTSVAFALLARKIPLQLSLAHGSSQHTEPLLILLQ